MAANEGCVRFLHAAEMESGSWPRRRPRETRFTIELASSGEVLTGDPHGGPLERLVYTIFSAAIASGVTRYDYWIARLANGEAMPILPDEE